METSGGATSKNWTEVVEDLVHGGEIDKAVSFLELTVSCLEKELQNSTSESSHSSVADKLSTALQDLSKLYSTKGLSLRADQILSRAFQIKHQNGDFLLTIEAINDGFSETNVSRDEANASDAIAEDESHGNNSSNLKIDSMPQDAVLKMVYPSSQSLLSWQVGVSEKTIIRTYRRGVVVSVLLVIDWEAIADRNPEDLLSPQSLPGVSKLSLEDSEAQGTKRRGRGTFSYKRPGLYSDNRVDESVLDDSENTSVGNNEDSKEKDLIYGTHHVLVLADFPPSTRTTDLEKMLGKFKGRFVIRWVTDMVALAVFRTPSMALEARDSIQLPFTVRVLDPGDELLSSIPSRDLEPPRPRPQTSARTAQRLIAQSMGIKLSSTFGSTELRKQEKARKNRIVSRQNMRDDAWGDE